MIELFLTLFFVFGVPGLVIGMLFRYRHLRQMKELEMRGGSQQVYQLQAQRSEMDQRLQNLETIVCGVDYELNAKLNRLASQQLMLAPATAAAGAASGDAAVPTAHALTIGLQAGAKLADRYLITKALGAGGMGAVYLAQDEQLGESVAIKVVAGASLLDDAPRERFRREVSAARRINHPNVVRIHDMHNDNGVLFLSMEFVSGGSLADLLQRHGKLAPAQLRPLIAQICSGLDAAHAAGVVHRDLKPANVLIDNSNNAKIIDFGLAWLPHVEGMTVTGMILGTPEYMAPEQIMGKPVDPRSDVYALGALIYHALVGRPPFTGPSPIAVGFAHCNQELVPPVQADGTVPPAWSQLVTRALAKDPSQRFASAGELAAALPA